MYCIDMETFIYTYYILAHIRTHTSIIPTQMHSSHRTYIHIIYTIYIHMNICIHRTYIIKYTYKYMHITQVYTYIDISIYMIHTRTYM